MQFRLFCRIKIPLYTMWNPAIILFSKSVRSAWKPGYPSREWKNDYFNPAQKMGGDFEVASVRVDIYDAANSLPESRYAAPNEERNTELCRGYVERANCP